MRGLVWVRKRPLSGLSVLHPICGQSTVPLSEHTRIFCSTFVCDHAKALELPCSCDTNKLTQSTSASSPLAREQVHSLLHVCRTYCRNSEL